MESVLLVRRAIVVTGAMWLGMHGATAAGVPGYEQQDLVPDERTAIAIARAVLLPIAGEHTIANEEPLVARREGHVWIVAGTPPQLPPNYFFVGGVSEIRLSAEDARILSVGLVGDK
jgi:hypothetical protein